jgi:hypothetical protein
MSVVASHTAIYYIHDNGGRPFEVTIDNTTNEVSVAKNDNWSGNYINILKYNPQKIFIGKSPQINMTEFSGGHGDRFDGNSILLNIKDNEYVFIGNEILSFQSLSEIHTFVSPFGNNDVPYPYAIDTYNNYYLLIEYVIISNYINEINHYEEPYEYYYDKRNIIKIKFNNISNYYVGTTIYNLTYEPFPESDYDRIIGWDEGKMFIKKLNDDKLYELTKKDYINLNKEFGLYMNFTKLNHTIIQPRL